MCKLACAIPYTCLYSIEYMRVQHGTHGVSQCLHTSVLLHAHMSVCNVAFEWYRICETCQIAYQDTRACVKLEGSSTIATYIIM